MDAVGDFFDDTLGQVPVLGKVEHFLGRRLQFFERLPELGENILDRGVDLLEGVTSSNFLFYGVVLIGAYVSFKIYTAK